MHTRRNWVAGLLSVAWLIIVLLPIAVLVKASIESQTSYAAHGPLALPHHLSSANFSQVAHSDFLHYLINTVIVTVAVVAIVLVVVPPLAFAIVRSRSRMTLTVFRLFVLGLAIPAQAVIVPLFYIMSKAGLYDSLAAIILPTAAFVLPVGTLILSGSMRDITSELYEAIAIDGAGSWRTFWRLVLPLSRGGLATITVYAALQAWNGFIFPLILTQSTGDRVYTLGLYNFQSQFGVDVPGLSAAVVVSIIPILLVYLFARRSLIQGMMGVGGK